MFRQKGILQPTSNGESKHKNPHRWIEEDVLLGLVTALLSLAPVTGPLADLARTLTCYLQIIKIVWVCKFVTNLPRHAWVCFQDFSLLSWLLCACCAQGLATGVWEIYSIYLENPSAPSASFKVLLTDCAPHPPSAALWLPAGYVKLLGILTNIIESFVIIHVIQRYTQMRMLRFQSALLPVLGFFWGVCGSGSSQGGRSSILLQRWSWRSMCLSISFQRISVALWSLCFGGVPAKRIEGNWIYVMAYVRSMCARQTQWHQVWHFIKHRIIIQK